MAKQLRNKDSGEVYVLPETRDAQKAGAVIVAESGGTWEWDKAPKASSTSTATKPGGKD
jgi:hypothetical protein